MAFLANILHLVTLYVIEDTKVVLRIHGGDITHRWYTSRSSVIAEKGSRSAVMRYIHIIPSNLTSRGRRVIQELSCVLEGLNMQWVVSRPTAPLHVQQNQNIQGCLRCDLLRRMLDAFDK